MTNEQLYFAIGLPVFAIITSLILSLVQISGIREDMRQMRTELHADMNVIRASIELLTGKVYEMMGKQ
jgi:hypothetical protein